MLGKIWESGQEMLDYQNSQGGEYNFFYPNGESVKIDTKKWYLVGLDELEKNSIVFDEKERNEQL